MTGDRQPPHPMPTDPPLPTGKMPPKLRLFSSVVVVVALAVAAVGLSLPAVHPTDAPLTPWARFAIAAAAMALAQLARLRLRIGSGTVNVAWGEAAIIVGLYLVPPGWLPAAVFLGTGLAVLLISMFSDRRSGVEIAHIAGSLTLATALGAAVTSTAHDPYVGPLHPDLALALAAGCLAYLVVTMVLVAFTLSLRHGLPFPRLLLRSLHGKLIMFVGNIVVGLAVVGLIEHDVRWLGLLPPALWLLQQTYAHRLRADEERRAWQSLADATGALNQLDERGVARAGVRGALELFGAECVEVDVVRPDGHRRRYAACAGRVDGARTDDAGDEVAESDVVDVRPRPSARAGAAADQRRADPIGLADLVGLPEGVGAAAQVGQVATRPLVVGGVLVGELRVHFPPGVHPAARERMSLQTFGEALGAALHDAATHRELRIMEARSTHDAVHDPLTGLTNRSALLGKGDTRLRLLPAEQPVALLLLDLNHFKEVNDTLGHAAGDELLQIAARRLGRLGQPGELLARLGGDEFALLMAPEPVPAGTEAPVPDDVATTPDSRTTGHGTTGHAAVGDGAIGHDATGNGTAGYDGAGKGSAGNGAVDEGVTRPEALGTLSVMPGKGPTPHGFVDRPAPMAVALRRARRITEELSIPTEVAGVQLSVEASVGVVVAPAGAADMTELLRRADIAMYQAKDGGGSVAWYDSARDAASTDHLALLAEMREALSVDDQLVLVLQPAVDLSSGAPTGVEALIRWRHPRRGRLNPGDFVRAVEGSELLGTFTRYVIDKALAAAAEWERQGVRVPISVNVSARSLLDPQLPADVTELLRRHQIPPHRLVLEITETVVMSEMEIIDEVLAGLRATGVQLAVDDFGTGFSSLTFLTRVSVDELKVDRAFVAKMVDSPEAAAIVRTTVELARSLGMRVVAEGVETAAQRTALAELGCTAAQGYHFFRPMPADKVITVLRSLLDEAQTARVVPLRAADDAS